MYHILIKHKVEDFGKWKDIFDAHAAMRSGAGSKGGYVFQNSEYHNEVFVLLEWDDIENARRFIESDDLKTIMEKAGVLEKPEIYFLETAEQPVT
jgi:hypothetical protein